MAFTKYAKGQLVHPWKGEKGLRAWEETRTASTEKSDLPGNLIHQASEIFQKEFNPDEYLLSHCTIVASVDTYAETDVKTGSIQEGNTTINRKYADYRITPETQDWINSNCFVPGTFITMADGSVKLIEEIEVGDQVLTHLGRSRTVTKLYQQNYDGSLFEVGYCGRGKSENLFVTPEHPLFVFESNKKCVHCEKEIVRNHKTIAFLLGKFYCSGDCYYQKKVANSKFLEEKTGSFVETQNLILDDFSASPVPQVQTQVDASLSLGQARLIGYFLAEGYYELDSRRDNKRVGVCWAFHEDETDTLAARVISLMKSEFDVDCVIRTHRDDKGITVTTKWNSSCVQFFETWVKGRGSKSKKLSKLGLWLSLDLQQEILKGWFEGDGSLLRTLKDIRLSGSSASYSLANQIQLMLFRSGVSCRVFKSVTEGRRRLEIDKKAKIVSDPSKECVSWQINVGGGWASSLVVGTVYEDLYFQHLDILGGIQNTPSFRFFKGYHVQKLTTLNEIRYSGVVYNFEVDEDNSYVANGIAVHNCDSWSRQVLNKSYRTFIGAANYQEHVQIPELTKGNIIDAVARDVGPSVYVDILVATDRKHRDLIASIESGKMSTLSMGCTIAFSICTKCGHVMSDEPEYCFPAETRVLKSDGQYVQIRDIVVGDEVISHMGKSQKVTELFVKDYHQHLVEVSVGNRLIRSTPNHPFYGIRQDSDCRCFCGGVSCGNVDNDKFEFIEAKDLVEGDFLAFPIPESYARMDINSDQYKRFGGLFRNASENPELWQEFLKSLGNSVGRVGNHLLHRITDLKKVPFCGKVYNFEVEEDHSYVVDGIAVHNCNHVKYEKGNVFYTKEGKKGKVAEICGYVDADDTGGVKFIEASWVATPAFQGAVLRNILTAKEVSPEMIRQAAQVLGGAMPKQWSDNSISKMASFGDMYAFDFDMGDSGGGDDSGDDEKKDEEEPKEEGDFKKLEEDVYKHVMKRVKKRFKSDIDKEDLEKQLGPEDSTVSPNDNVIKQAADYKENVELLIKIAKSDAEFIDKLATLNEGLGISVPISLYRTSLKVGSFRKYSDLSEFLSACHGELGTKPSLAETRTLIRLSKFLEKLEE